MLVDPDELSKLLAVSGQKPRQAADVSTHAPHLPTPTQEAPSVVSTPPAAPAHVDLAVELERLRAQVEVERLRTELAGVTAERDALARRVADLEADRDRSAAQQGAALAGLRDDAAHWREVALAREAELQAERQQLRATQGAPWWRRLLGGPVATEPPELPGWTVEQLPPEAK